MLPRVIYFGSYLKSPFFQVPMWDAAEYHELALSLARAQIPSDFAFRAPLYPVFLGLVYAVFGSAPISPRIFQLGLSVWSCLLVYRIGSRIFNRTSGLIAGLLTACSGLLIYFTFELLPTTLFIFLLLLYLYELTLINRDQGSVIKAGIWFSLAVLTRPVILVFLPVSIWFLWQQDRHPRRLIQYLITALLPLLLSLFIHLAHGDGGVLVSAQGGVNFYIGNHQQADGITANLPGKGAGWGWKDVREIAQNDQQRALNAAQIDRTFYGLAVKEITADYGVWLKRLLRKAALFWNHIEISSNRDLYYQAQQYPLIGFLWWIGLPWILPLGLTGMIFAIRSSSGKQIVILIVVYFLVTIMFFVNSRFRMPLVPLFFILAAGSVFGLRDLIRDKFPRRATLTVGLLFGLGLVLPFSTRSGVDPNRLDYGYFTEGRVLEQLGRTAEAQTYYQKALAANPRAPYVNYYLSELAGQQQNLVKASQFLKEELKIQPDFVIAWNSLGVNYMEFGLSDSALFCFQRAQEIQPGYPEAQANTGRVWAFKALAFADSANWPSSLSCIEKALRVDSRNVFYRLIQIENRIQIGDTIGVRRQLQTLGREHPELKEIDSILRELHEPGQIR